ncbi:hypothetical protein AMATHDRAFT_174581 [Amanita thiersii Skay4041]|uniref:Methyltransferase domain-containing protein n=1 Tax=Amanita thiersii Skay4041 TaxID=703135 RepID=A0A2A9NVU3_9AGAR|nr:hypothetical protein AMATHDRAFT_174581 [Amanita thiersii Skay4041]
MHTNDAHRLYTPHSDIYLFAHDDRERGRLEGQHQVLTHGIGGLLHPPVHFSSGNRILDVGAGTGAWILDLARTLDSAVQLYGTDIEKRLFPRSHPDNVQFVVASTLNLPEAWTNTFKLVHQRLAMASFRVPEWPQAIKEIYRVTAPDGWVQLEEFGIYKAGPATDILRACHNELWVKNDLLPNIHSARMLHGWLTEAGFVDVIAVKHQFQIGDRIGKHGEHFRSVMTETFKGLGHRGTKEGGFAHASQEEYERLVRMFLEEVNKYPGVAFDYWVICARKPSS